MISWHLYQGFICSFYLIIVIPDPYTGQREQLRQQAECLSSLNINAEKSLCYVAVEFLPQEINLDGMIFHVGDGKRYKRTFNPLLFGGRNYEILLAVKWKPEVSKQ